MDKDKQAIGVSHMYTGKVLLVKVPTNAILTTFSLASKGNLKASLFVVTSPKDSVLVFFQQACLCKIILFNFAQAGKQIFYIIFFSFLLNP